MTKKSTLKLIVAAIFCFYLQHANAAFPMASSKTENTATVTKAPSVNTATPEKEVAINSIFKKEVKEIVKKEIKNANASAGSGSGGGKNQIVALLLAVLLFGLGIHRFYLGHIWQGVLMLLTAGGCGVWALIDVIRIITGDLQPKNGTYDKTL